MSWTSLFCNCRFTLHYCHFAIIIWVALLIRKIYRQYEILFPICMKQVDDSIHLLKFLFIFIFNLTSSLFLIVWYQLNFLWCAKTKALYLSKEMNNISRYYTSIYQRLIFFASYWTKDFNPVFWCYKLCLSGHKPNLSCTCE